MHHSGPPQVKTSSINKLNHKVTENSKPWLSRLGWLQVQATLTENIGPLARG